jgi:tetratricopeptide (TPR) repeat protein
MSFYPWTEMQAGRFDSAVIAFKRLLDVDSTRADAWAGLAWCHYQLFHYEDALSASARAVQFDPSELQWQSLRACILTELGVQSSSLPSLLEASSIFASIASQSQLWVDHYNYANALAALERHDEAVASYRRALKLDESHAEVWKNLGSSLHHLGKHEEEMRCLDRALVINPTQPQALLSKGVSTLIDQNRPTEAIRLIEKAREVAPTLFDHWSAGWNWLVRAYITVNDLDTALDRIRIATKNVPGDESLRSLEGFLLHRLWRTRPELIAEALRINELLHSIHPDEYAYVEELVALRLALEDEASAWSLLVDWYKRFGLGTGRSLAFGGMRIREVMAAFRFLPQYMAFRRLRPAAEYFAGATIIHNAQAATDSKIEAESVLVDSLTVALAVAFGVAQATVASVDGTKPRGAMVKAIRRAAEVLVATIPGVFEICSIPVRPLSLESRIDWISEAVARAPLIVLVEVSSLAGWMMGHLRPPMQENAADQVIKRIRFEKIQGAIVERTFLQVNKRLEVIPEP